MAVLNHRLVCCIDKITMLPPLAPERMDIAEAVRKAAASLGYDELRDEQLKALCMFVVLENMHSCPTYTVCVMQC